MTDVTKLAAECVHTSQMLRHDGRLLAAAGAVGAAAGVYLYVRRRRSSHPPQMIHYDEFGLFRDNCTEHGLVYNGPPTVVRERVVLPDGRGVSALRWGEGEVEMVLLHGGAQNAHTFDTCALALRPRNLLCVGSGEEVPVMSTERAGLRKDGAQSPHCLSEAFRPSEECEWVELSASEME